MIRIGKNCRLTDDGTHDMTSGMDLMPAVHHIDTTASNEVAIARTLLLQPYFALAPNNRSQSPCLLVDFQHSVFPDDTCCV